MEKLNFELVPDGCWYSNLRSILSPAQWDVVRKEAYARANGRCMICGAPSARLEAHERWEYDEKTHTQKLANVVAICKRCHEVIHIGRTQHQVKTPILQNSKPGVLPSVLLRLVPYNLLGRHRIGAVFVFDKEVVILEFEH